MSFPSKVDRGNRLSKHLPNKVNAKVLCYDRVNTLIIIIW